MTTNEPPPEPDSTWVERFDADNDWMAALDWSRHRRRASDYVSEKLMFSSVVEVFVKHLCAPAITGIADFIAQAGNTPAGGMTGADEAFADDGTPLFSVHERLGPVMRRHADENGVAIARADAISRDEWEEIVIAAEGRCSIGSGARHAAAGVAPVIAHLAAEERLTCYARPIGGGPTIPIPGREWWDVDPEVAIGRVATCGLAIDRPFDAAAPVDHLIFVNRANVQNVAIEAARTTYIPIAALEYGPWLFKRPVDHYAVQIEEVAAFLVSKMRSPKCQHWTNRMFQEEVVAEFGQRGLGRCFERAKAMAIAHPELAHFGFRRPAGP